MWTLQLNGQWGANPVAENRGKYVRETERVGRKHKEQYTQGIELKIDRLRKICM